MEQQLGFTTEGFSSIWRMTRLGSRCERWFREAWEAATEAEFKEDQTVHLCGIFSAAEEDKYHKITHNRNPAVEEYIPVRWNLWDIVPVRSMSTCPRVRVPWADKHAVVIDDEDLNRENPQEHQKR